MKLIVSFGDPNGVGFETFVKAFYVTESTFQDIEFAIVANAGTIQEYIEKSKLNATIENNYLRISEHKIKIIPIPYVPIKFGKVTEHSGQFAFNSLKIATELVKNQEFDVLLTLPISKYSISLADFNFPGQTEYLAYVDNNHEYLMILFNEKIKVALATIHIPLKDVSAAITYDKLKKDISTFRNSLKRDFGAIAPKIAVLSLNPHSGEMGKIGTEEIDTIIPVINHFQEQLCAIFGPFSSDSFFRDEEYLLYDGIFAMYHDQGLIPLKMNSKNGGVNFTAGLSFIRVSPDHGTAFDIAGKSIANPMGTYQAIIWSEIIFKNRNKS